jgi:hypothetical protein
MISLKTLFAKDLILFISPRLRDAQMLYRPKAVDECRGSAYDESKASPLPAIAKT